MQGKCKKKFYRHSFYVACVALVSLIIGCGGEAEEEFTVVEPMPVDDLIAQLPAPWNEKTLRVPDAENGYVYLKALSDLNPGVLPSGSVFVDVSDSQVRKQLEVFEPWFEYLEIALDMKYWQAPLPEGSATLFPELPLMKDIQHGLVQAAKLELKDGRTNEAISLLLLSDRFADSQTHAGGSVIHFLVGVAMSSISERAIMQAVATKKLSSSQLNTLLATTEGMDLTAAMRNALLDDVHGLSGYVIAQSHFPDTIDSQMWDDVSDDARFANWEYALREIFIGHKDPLDQVETATILAEVYDELLISLDLPYSSGSKSEAHLDERTKLWLIKDLNDFLSIGNWTDEQIATVKERVKNEPNPYGQLLVSILITPTDRLDDIVFRSRTNSELVRTVIGLRLYEARRGSLPQTLAALVEAGFLSSVPQDHFTGQTIQYDASRRIVWSIGDDFVDDGGTGEDYKFKPDMVVPF